MSSNDQYVLATGEEGAFRLRVLDSVHGPHTRRLLQDAGLAPGMRVADIGCGIGMVSTWIASQVGPEGEVHGVDLSPEQIAQARAEAERRGLANLHFHAAGAYDTGLPRGTFDLVFSRFLLMHLSDPARALQEMRALLAPGGVLVCEDGDVFAPYTDPPSTTFDRLNELYRAAVKHRGGDPMVVRNLHHMFWNAGLRDAQMRLVQPACTHQDAKRIPEWTLIECAPMLVAEGITTQDEIDRIIAEMRALTAKPSTMLAVARMVQIWARTSA